LNKPLRVHFDRAEHHQRKEREDASAERDEHIVDHQFPSKPDEVHARTLGEPAPSGVGEADGQPQGNGQMQSGQELSVAPLGKRVDVGENGARCEGQRQPEAGGHVRPALP
jgi:hypothetical protein